MGGAPRTVSPLCNPAPPRERCRGVAQIALQPTEIYDSPTHVKVVRFERPRYETHSARRCHPAVVHTSCRRRRPKTRKLLHQEWQDRGLRRLPYQWLYPQQVLKYVSQDCDGQVGTMVHKGKPKKKKACLFKNTPQPVPVVWSANTKGPVPHSKSNSCPTAAPSWKSQHPTEAATSSTSRNIASP